MDFDPPRFDDTKSPEERMAAWTARRKKINEGLLRAISAWAGIHERCPLAGCRRNRTCLHLNDCRYVSDEPPMTEEEHMELGRQVRAAVEADLERRRREGLIPPDEASDGPPVRTQRKANHLRRVRSTRRRAPAIPARPSRPGAPGPSPKGDRR